MYRKLAVLAALTVEPSVKLLAAAAVSTPDVPFDAALLALLPEREEASEADWDFGAEAAAEATTDATAELADPNCWPNPWRVLPLLGVMAPPSGAGAEAGDDGEANEVENLGAGGEG